MSPSPDPTAENPRKRLKVDEEFPRGAVNAQAAKEAEVGITEFVSRQDPGFYGILKKRFAIFQHFSVCSCR